MQLTIQQSVSPEQSYFFQALPNKFIQNKQTKQLFTKWGLFDTLRVGTFRFNQSFSEFRMEGFLGDLFGNANVRYMINNIKFQNESISSIKFDKLSCNQLTTQMFEILNQNNIVINDYIAKIFGETFQGIEICDKLRECLLIQESQYYTYFTDKQRNQLLFKLFQLLVLGGSLNQYDDTLTPYLECTKNFYKNVVSVKKQSQYGQIFIDSIAIEIKQIDKGLFKKQSNPQTVLFVVISPSTRIVHVISNRWVKFW